MFNLGIHYFDLAFYLFGEPEAYSVKIEKREAQGTFRGGNYFCSWKINTDIKKNEQHRIFRINNKNYDFSSKENLHQLVYADLIRGRGILPEESSRSIFWVEKLNE